MDKAVLCKNVTKIYGEGEATVNALRGIDLEVEAAEILMIVGPSGSGKTTLLSVISSLLTQNEGECLIYGKDLNHLDEKERTLFRGKNIGFVFQSFNLLPMLSAQENVAIPLILNNSPPNEAMEAAADLLTEMGLKERMHALPPQMSGGEQQRVAIARGCIHHPSLIVCDEPTSALDHETGEKILELLSGIARSQKVALIIVTHDQRIFQFADRLLKMEDGKITGVYTNQNNSKKS